MSETLIAELEHVTVHAMPNASARVIPKQKGTLMQLSEAARVELFTTASVIARLLYDALEIQGTNVIIHDNGETYAEILGRTEQDGIELKWQPNKASPKDLQDVAGRIKNDTWIIGKKDTADVKNPVIEERKSPETLTTQSEPEKKPEVKKQELDRPDMHPPGERGEHGLDDVAAAIQQHVKKGPTEETDYRIKHLTRRR